MASAASLFLFFALFLSLFALHSDAREPQSFTKLSPGVYGDTVAAESSKDKYESNPQKSEPVFQPENQNAYGLFSQNRADVKEAAAVSDFHRYLPKNYNPVAYVTQPEDFSEQSKIQSEEKYYPSDESEDSHPSKYNSGSYNNERFNEVDHASLFGSGSHSSGLSSTSLRGGGAFFPASVDRFPQGMSDTRAMENGRYFYDVNNERFNGNHPYEMMKESGSRYPASTRRNYGTAFPGAVAGEGYQYGNWP